MKNNPRINRWSGRILAVAVLALFGVGDGDAQSTTPPTISPPSVASNPRPASSNTAPAPQQVKPSAPPNKITGDIRDIRGPIHIPSRWFWVWWLAGGAALATLLYAGWRWSRHRARAAILLPHQRALLRLENARKLIQPENAREFSIEVSEIVRQFIEERFDVRAARRTTEEFLHDLLQPSDPLLASHRDLLADFLGYCDLAKFARWVLTSEEMRTMMESAHTFILHAGTAPAATDQTSAANSPVPPILNQATP